MDRFQTADQTDLTIFGGCVESMWGQTAARPKPADNRCLSQPVLVRDKQWCQVRLDVMRCKEVTLTGGWFGSTCGSSLKCWASRRCFTASIRKPSTPFPSQKWIRSWNKIMNIQQEVCLRSASFELHFNLGSDNIELLSSLPAHRAPQSFDSKNHQASCWKTDF